MLTDHVGALLIGPVIGTSLNGQGWIFCYILTRLVGRLAFPFYCFLIAEGIHHSRDRIEYAKRLFLFAKFPSISQYIKIQCAWKGRMYNFTLGMPVLMFVPVSLWLRLILFPVACILSAAVGSDYGLIGPIVIYGIVLGMKNWGKYVVAIFIIGYGVYALVPGITWVYSFLSSTPRAWRNGAYILLVLSITFDVSLDSPGLMLIEIWDTVFELNRMQGLKNHEGMKGWICYINFIVMGSMKNAQRHRKRKDTK